MTLTAFAKAGAAPAQRPLFNLSRFQKKGLVIWQERAKLSLWMAKIEWLPIRLTLSSSVVRALGAIRDHVKNKDIAVPSIVLTGAPVTLTILWFRVPGYG